MALLPLTVNCFLCRFANLNTIADTGGQTCSPFEIRQLPGTGFHQCCVITVFTVCAIAGEAQAKAKMGVFPLQGPPFSSVILIWKVCLAIDFLHLPKDWWTAAWSDSYITHPGHLADINNQLFPSSLFGITRTYIRPNSHLLAAKLLEAPNSFSPYKVIQSVVGQGEDRDGSIRWDIRSTPSSESCCYPALCLCSAVNTETFGPLSFISA